MNEGPKRLCTENKQKLLVSSWRINFCTKKYTDLWGTFMNITACIYILFMLQETFSITFQDQMIWTSAVAVIWVQRLKVYSQMIYQFSFQHKITSLPPLFHTKNSIYSHIFSLFANGKVHCQYVPLKQLLTISLFSFWPKLLGTL